MNSHAQFGTDLAVLSFFPAGFVGRYLDIGASYPIYLSNTYALYERGWNGVTVEPVESCVLQHERVRGRDVQIRGVIGSYDGDSDFFECDEPSVSTACPDEASRRMATGQGVSKRTVPSYTVASLLRKGHGTLGDFVPDVVSIDVEGRERDVLEGCPFEQGWLPYLIVIEACRPCTTEPCHDEWEHILAAHGYEFRRQCGVNRIYTRGDGPCVV